MAEEDTDSLVTLEKMDDLATGTLDPLNNGLSSGTVSKKQAASVGVGDSSTGVPSEESPSRSSSPNVTSRYLRPSNGSCHDFCKYGRKHIFEEKPWKAVRRRDSRDSADVLLILEKDKLVNRVLSEDIRDDCSSKVKPSPKTKSSASSDKEKGVLRLKSPNLSCRETKTPSLKTKTDSRALLRGSDGSQTCLVKQKPSAAKKHISPEPPEIIKNVCFPSEIAEVPMEQCSSVDSNRLKNEDRKTNRPKKNLSVVKSKGGTNKLSGGIQTSQTRPAFKVSRRQVLHPPMADLYSGRSLVKASSKRESAASISGSPCSGSLGKSPSFKLRKGGQLKLSSSLKDEYRGRRVKHEASGFEKPFKKTLRVIKTETEEKVVELIPDKNARSSGGESKVYGKKQSWKVKVPPIKEDQSKILRKGSMAVSEDAAPNGFPVKLKFKTGKVLDPQTDTCSPRRLRFRRPPRLYGNETSKIDLRKKAFANAGITASAAPIAEISSQKVVLKHQDVQDKKDAQGLFNNVIEETASKLVATRKSKVKALVGAFETVISLQESKPSHSAV